MSLTEKIQAHGPKKILALDGGGIRGMLSVEILAKLEDILRERSGERKEFRPRRLLRFLCRHEHRSHYRCVSFLGHDGGKNP